MHPVVCRMKLKGIDHVNNLQKPYSSPPHRVRCCPGVCETLCRHADVWLVVRFTRRVSCPSARLSAFDVTIRGGLFYLLSKLAGRQAAE